MFSQEFFVFRVERGGFRACLAAAMSSRVVCSQACRPEAVSCIDFPLTQVFPRRDSIPTDLSKPYFTAAIGGAADGLTFSNNVETSEDRSETDGAIALRQGQLERILASPEFRASPRLRELLE